MSDTDAAAAGVSCSHIGEKYVLFLVSWSKDATRDGVGRPGDGWVVDEEVPVTVVEQRPVQGEYDPHGELRHVGIKARAEDGREFTRWWYAYPDTVLFGVGLLWDHFVDARGRVHEVQDGCLSYRWRRALGYCFGPDGQLKLPTEAVLCNRHDVLHLPGEVCLDCRLGDLFGATYIRCPYCDVERASNDHAAQRNHIHDAHPEEFVRHERASRQLDGWAAV